jgi:hypothetical protein
MISNFLPDSKKLTNDFLGLCEKYISLKIENKKYEDWKYITVGIHSFTFSLKIGKNSFYQNWILGST